MGKISEGLDEAGFRTARRPIPVSTSARVRFLVRVARGSTRVVAEQLGVSQRSVERYLTGQRRRPPEAVAGRIEERVRRAWQPRLRQRAQKRAAASGGITIVTRARFGFAAAAGSSDDPRVRRITQHLPPRYAAQLLEAHGAGATEEQLAAIVARGLGECCLRDSGRRAQGLGVVLTDVVYLDADYG